jgi:hypothetical protein
MGAGILKNTIGSNYGKTSTTLRKASVDSVSDTKKSQTNRPETGARSESESSDRTKKTTKTGKSEKTEKTDNESDEDSDGKTSMSPVSKALTAKTSLKKVNKKRGIIFEEELYKKEKRTKELDANLFIGYMIEFFEEEEEVIMPPPDYHDNSKSF